MTQAPPHVSLNGSRLVRCLAELLESDTPVSHKNYAQRLGRLIDLSDSIALSAAQRQLPALGFEPTPVSTETVMADFLERRAAVVQNIVTSFQANGTPGANKWQRLPTVKADATLDEVAVYEAYQRFYATHQREIEFKVQKLRVSVRESASGLSPQLAQLAALDQALEDALSVQSRKLFAAVPKLLKQRFEQLLKQHRSTLTEDADAEDAACWMQADGWLGRFCREMQGLLLAELEARLQPVLGLIEALNEEVGSGL